MTNTISFTKLFDDAIIPSRGTPNSAGFDLYAQMETTITGGEGNVIIPTGVSVRLPLGTYGRIAARSGLSVKQHMAVSAGVIDLDYSGEIGIVAFCTKNGHTYTVKKGEKFAQLIPEQISYPQVIDPSVDTTTVARNHVGWGSTGH